MKRNGMALASVVAAAVLVATALVDMGCGSDLKCADTLRKVCRENSECCSDQVCVLGRCTPKGSVPDSGAKDTGGGGDPGGVPDSGTDGASGGDQQSESGTPDYGIPEAPADIPPPEPNPNRGKHRWSYTSGSAITSPAVSRDGKLVVISANGLYALNTKDGSMAWSLVNLALPVSEPVIAPDGAILVGTRDGKLISVDPTTHKKNWTTAVGEDASTQPPGVDSKGNIYVATTKDVNSYDGKGKARWAKPYTLSGKPASPPTIAPDGTVYICTSDKSLIALKSDGTLKWSVATGTEACYAPAIDSDGTVYTGADSIYAVKPDGKMKWKPVSRYGEITSPVVLDGRGHLYAGTFKGKIIKLKTASGEPANFFWSDGITVTGSGSVGSAPCLGDSGYIYVATNDSVDPFVNALNPSNGEVIWANNAAHRPFSGHPAMGPDGTLYAGTQGGTFLAIETDSSGLGRTPWPRAYANSQSTSSR